MNQPPAAVVDSLDDADDETLQAVIEYCQAGLEADDELAEPTKADSDPPEEFEGDAEQWADAVDGSEAPARATTTIKTIKENQYVYFQWSEDGQTKSEYVAPVNPKR